MKKVVAVTAIMSGILLFIVPRYILPTCEYEGYSPMYCLDTARAEYVTGTVLLLIGCSVIFIKKNTLLSYAAAALCMTYGIAFWLPDRFGYCHSTRMPCNYGMIPGIRFIAVTGMFIMIIANIGLLKKPKTKGNP
jgi:hypothetical protein